MDLRKKTSDPKRHEWKVTQLQQNPVYSIYRRHLSAWASTSYIFFGLVNMYKDVGSCTLIH